jgi:hypothetical protein
MENMFQASLKTARRVTFLFIILFSGHAVRGFAQDSGAADTTIRIKQVVLATDVTDGAPTDIKANFSMADRYAFCHVNYENHGMPTTLRFKWYLNDSLLLNFQAKTPTGTGRSTYSVVTLQPGNWKVDVIAPGGATLKTLKFKVTP